MGFNDIFKLVSLRHSKPSRGASSTREPRLRYRRLLEAQAVMRSSPRDIRLQALRARHHELSEKAKQLESIQRAVFASYMREQHDKAPSIATTMRRLSTSRDVKSPVDHFTITNRKVFVERVEAHLTKAEIALFRDVMGGVGGAQSNFAGIMSVLEVGIFTNEANRLCAEIQAIEDNISEGLPTAPVQPPSSSVPIVAAVGWGDLIVARESLVGYEAREIAHVENILPGETKVREHQRLSKAEEIQETETITEKESEKDSQTTDRYELQAEAQETIERDFSVSAGVNTSGRYGVTRVETSLDAAFAQSQSQSRTSSINTAREIVTKAVERTFERVRRLRRLTITEEIRELNRHDLTNAGAGRSAAISGIYLWVEKIQKVELRHYGRRMMVEFHIPEPAVSLFERAAVPSTRKKLPPFKVSPSGIDPENYMCLAQRYGALDIEPPPTQFIEVGFGWTSTLNEDAQAWAEDQFTSTINIPKGYRPYWAKVAWSGIESPNEKRDFNFAFSVAGQSPGIVYTDAISAGVPFQLNVHSDWPQGVPVSGRVRGTWDGAMYVHVTMSCIRTAEAMDLWRLRTWQSLRNGYEAIERSAAQDEQQQAFQRSLPGPGIGERPAAENRRIERAELQKWAIKSMRLVPQNFNAMEQIGEFQELNPLNADAQAPIVRFYEDAFEWDHMNYFLYPYHWARRASWRVRTAVDAVDSRHKAFLEAGAARVIVPVTPGFEDKVAWFLDESNAEVNELERILAKPPTTPPSASTGRFRDLWMELLTDHKADLARGSGSLDVKNGSAQVKINADSEWRTSKQRDIGRELYIDGNRYEVAAVTNDTNFDLDRPYEGTSDPGVRYVAGSTAFGPPWTVNVPTSLIVLAENVPTLKAV